MKLTKEYLVVKIEGDEPVGCEDEELKAGIEADLREIETGEPHEVVPIFKVDE